MDYGGTVDRPVASESPARAKPELLPVPKVFKEDVSIKSEITDGDVGLPGADRGVDLVAAEGEIVLVQPEAVDDRYIVAPAKCGAAHEIGEAIGQTGALREQRGLVSQTIALTDEASQRKSGHVEVTFRAQGDARSEAD